VDILIGNDAADGRYLAGPSTDQVGGLYTFVQVITMCPIEVETDFIHPAANLALEKTDGFATAELPGPVPGRYGGPWAGGRGRP
jgi:hypothetical protein